MTEKQALEQGLVVCECGHPKNNHFDFESFPCAHCKCKKYTATARVGVLEIK